jgi:hypothetical protein
VNSERQRRAIQARINIARDLIDRVETCLVSEWNERCSFNLISYTRLALEGAGVQLGVASVQTDDLETILIREETENARPK